MKEKELKEIVKFLQMFPRQQVLLKELLIDFLEAQEMIKILTEEKEDLLDEIENMEDEIERINNIEVIIH